MNTATTIRLTPKIKEELLNTLDLAEAYIGCDVKEQRLAILGECPIDYDNKIKSISNKVVLSTGFGFDILRSRSRKREITVTRQFAIYQIYNECYPDGLTLQSIGDIFNRDHSLVLHSVKQIRTMIEVNDHLIRQIRHRYNELEN